jgi:hypothetical protein
MSLVIKVLLKVRESRGRKPLYKRRRNEPFIKYMTRMVDKKTKLGKDLTSALTHNRVSKNTFPLCYLTGMNDDTTVKRKLERECWMQKYKKK